MWISRASTVDLARPSFCCPATELKSTAERSDGQFHMNSDGDSDERFRYESIFQAMCWLVRPAKKSNCAVFFLRLPRETCFDQRQWFWVSAQMLFLMSLTTFPSCAGAERVATVIGLACQRSRIALY